jgi:aspartate aminotransferase
VDSDPDNVLIVPGGKVTMFMAILMFGEPGVDILYPDPGFPIYRSMIEFTGARPFPCRSARKTILRFPQRKPCR